MDFYIVCGDASSPSFSNNHSGDFKVLLSKEIDLNNIEYSVAVCSVGRYYETVEKDVVFIREKRATTANDVEPLQLTVHTTYPATSNVDKIKKMYDGYLKKGDPIYAVAKDKERFEIELDVDGKKDKFEIYSNPIYKKTLESAISFKSDWFDDVRLELSDMLGVGTLTLICT